ncbi:MAG TPA: substrate-binding domain-containing protein [Spirochaetia bacterium]|nr:substrate-binding domain-containing protein [Spirochaetia bacterium]
MKRILFTLLVLFLAAVCVFGEAGRLRMSTTTSTENSGLLTVMLPAFERMTGLKVDVIAVGTGKALALGEHGDVDAVLVHAREAEDAFVAKGFGVNRRDVMHNDFIILGPKEDPAGIRGMKDAGAALKRISGKQASFISRGDNSGTHLKEKQLWKEAGIQPAGRWYKEAGQGMGAVLIMANDMQGYTLADRGTYLAMRDKLQLSILVEGDPRLFNPYGIIAVNPKRYPSINHDGAMKLIDFITSKTGQEIIASYKVNGEILFFPDALK